MTHIFVTVGTDHHPFGRLITWLDSWMADHPDVTLVVQHGHSPASTTGTNYAMMGLEELTAEYEAADLVVAQVGPGTIVDANKVGLRPIMVPRDPDLGEVVDDHQFVFGALMEKQGRCAIVTDEDSLRIALNLAVADPSALRLTTAIDTSSASEAVSNLAQQITSSPRSHVSIGRILTMVRAPRSRS